MNFEVSGYAPQRQPNSMSRRTRCRLEVPVAALSLAALLVAPSALSAQCPIGTVQRFAVLGATPSVTNTGATTITGDVGIYPAASITGTGTITLTGASAYQANNGVSQGAQSDATTAYNCLAGLPFTSNLTGSVLGTGGTVPTLTPGVYFFSSAAQLTGNLTLDFLGNPNAAFVFQIGTGLTTSSGSSVSVLNGGPSSGVYWAVGSFATLGTTTAFAGNIFANTETIALETGATLCGRAIDRIAAVTMDNNTISINCSASGEGSLPGIHGINDFGSGGFGGPAEVVPEPMTMTMLATGLVGLAAAQRRRRKA